MLNLAKSENEKVIERFLRLRTTLLLNFKQIDEGSDLTKGTYRRIEIGEISSSLDNIGAIIFFFGFEYHEFFNFAKPLPDEATLRRKMERFHKKHNSTAYQIINEQPDLIELVEHRLIPAGAFNEWVTTADIEGHLTKNYAQYTYTNVSATLLRAAEKRKILTFRKFKGSGRGGEQHEYKKVDTGK